MAFAKPLVIDYGAGTKTLNFINQDSYGSEYFLTEPTQEFRCKIRHTRENPTKGGTVMVRHNVELTRTIFGTGGSADKVQQAYLVFRHEARDNVTDAAEIGASLSALMDEAAYQDLGAWLS
jgi:hypothetical protein